MDRLNPGQGRLDSYLFGVGGLTEGMAGAGLQYGHRISDSWSAYLGGRLGYRYGHQRGLGYEAKAGLRGTWKGNP